MSREAELQVRPLSASDFPIMLRILEDTRPPLGRMTSDSAYRALMAESLRGRGLWWLVAVDKNTILGFSVAIRYGATFWRRFLIRHPALLPPLLIDHLRRGGRRLLPPRADEAPLHSAPPSTAFDTSSGPRWTDNGAHIAKALQIYVDPRSRGQGIALKLNKALVDILRNAGITRLDAHIAARNVASVRLVQSTGWTVYRDGSHYLVSTCLADTRD